MQDLLTTLFTIGILYFQLRHTNKCDRHRPRRHNTTTPIPSPGVIILHGDFDHLVPEEPEAVAEVPAIAETLPTPTPEPKAKTPTLAALKAEAKARGLKGYSKLKKNELLALLGM